MKWRRLGNLIIRVVILDNYCKSLLIKNKDIFCLQYCGDVILIGQVFSNTF